MTDEQIPDVNEAFYVHETLTDSASDTEPYQAYYGPYSKDAANEFAAQLETAFHDREAAITNPDGPAPVAATRTQGLELVTAAQFDTAAQANLQPDAPESAASPTVPDAPASSAPVVEDVTAGSDTAEPTPLAEPTPAPAADPAPAATPAADPAAPSA